MARRSLKPQLNQIRTWVRQGRTDAWIAHQLESSVKDIAAFKREHDLAPADSANGDQVDHGPRVEEELDLRAEDEALVAAALEAQEEEAAAAEDDPSEDDSDSDSSEEGAADGQPKRRRRGRRGGRGRSRARKPLDGTFDHGEEGYGLWLDPAVQDDPVYAEHWAGHRPVSVSIEADRIVITRAGEDAGDSDDED